MLTVLRPQSSRRSLRTSAAAAAAARDADDENEHADAAAADNCKANSLASGSADKHSITNTTPTEHLVPTDNHLHQQLIGCYFFSY